MLPGRDFNRRACEPVLTALFWGCGNRWMLRRRCWRLHSLLLLLYSPFFFVSFIQSKACVASHFHYCNVSGDDQTTWCDRPFTKETRGSPPHFASRPVNSPRSVVPLEWQWRDDVHRTTVMVWALIRRESGENKTAVPGVGGRRASSLRPFINLFFLWPHCGSLQLLPPTNTPNSAYSIF